MAKRRLTNRRSSRRSSIASEYLNPDSAVLDDEKSFWWNNLTNKSDMQSFVESGTMNQTSKYLDSNSKLELSSEEHGWWKRINSSESENSYALSGVIKAKHTDELHNAEESNMSDSEKERTLIQKRKVSLHITSRKSESNAFLTALHDSNDSQKKDRKNYSNISSDKISVQSNTNKKNNSVEDTINHSDVTENIKKFKPQILKRSVKRKSTNMFEDALKEDNNVQEYKKTKLPASVQDTSRIQLIRDLTDFPDEDTVQEVTKKQSFAKTDGTEKDIQTESKFSQDTSNTKEKRTNLSINSTTTMPKNISPKKSKIKTMSNSINKSKDQNNLYVENHRDSSLENYNIDRSNTLQDDRSSHLNSSNNQKYVSTDILHNQSTVNNIRNTMSKDNVSMDKSDDYQVLKSKTKFLKRPRKSTGNNIFQHIISQHVNNASDVNQLGSPVTTDVIEKQNNSTKTVTTNISFQKELPSHSDDKSVDSTDESDNSVRRSISPEYTFDNHTKDNKIRSPVTNNVIKMQHSPRKSIISISSQKELPSHFDDNKSVDSTDESSNSVRNITPEYTFDNHTKVNKIRSPVTNNVIEMQHSPRKSIITSISSQKGLSFHSDNKSVDSTDESNNSARNVDSVNTDNNYEENNEVEKENTTSLEHNNSSIVESVTNIQKFITTQGYQTESNESFLLELKNVDECNEDVQNHSNKEVRVTNQEISTNLNKKNISIINKQVLESVARNDNSKSNNLSHNNLEFSRSLHKNKNYSGNSANKSFESIENIKTKSKVSLRSNFERSFTSIIEPIEDKTSRKHSTQSVSKVLNVSVKKNKKTPQVKKVARDKSINSSSNIANVNKTKEINKERQKSIIDFLKTNIFTNKNERSDTANLQHATSFQNTTNKKVEELKRELEMIKKENRIVLSPDIQLNKKTELHTKNKFANNNVKKMNLIKFKKNLISMQETVKDVNKAYIVNGKVYKKPKLPRPKHWATDRLYRYLWKCLEPKYKLATRKVSEKFVELLASVVDIVVKRTKYDNYKKELNNLMKDASRLGIINTRNDFYHFCYDFLPYEFRIKATPILLPGNTVSIPYDPEKLHMPLHKN